jgi:Uma2 family endonuclease
MASVLEGVIPETKPALELIDDRLCQKVSPRYSHARLQGIMFGLLAAWARGRGRVGTEWRFTFEVNGRFASLVPDVAFLSYERAARANRTEAEEPAMPPDLAVEIRSPSDWQVQVERKTALYLDGGARCVFELDPLSRTVTVHTRDGATTYGQTEVVVRDELPGFRLDLLEVFAALDD